METDKRESARGGTDTAYFSSRWRPLYLGSMSQKQCPVTRAACASACGFPVQHLPGIEIRFKKSTRRKKGARFAQVHVHSKNQPIRYISQEAEETPRATIIVNTRTKYHALKPEAIEFHRTHIRKTSRGNVPEETASTLLGAGMDAHEGAVRKSSRRPDNDRRKRGRRGGA